MHTMSKRSINGFSIFTLLSCNFAFDLKNWFYWKVTSFKAELFIFYRNLPTSKTEKEVLLHKNILGGEHTGNEKKTENFANTFVSVNCNYEKDFVIGNRHGINIKLLDWPCNIYNMMANQECQSVRGY